MGFVLGIDISTTAAKALLVDKSGTVIGVASAEYGYDTPHPRWAEQHPGIWWDATISATSQVMNTTSTQPAQVEAIGLTGQMHGSVLLDAAKQVIRPALLWNDQRTAAECDLIRGTIGFERLVALTGNDALTGFTSPKLIWVREHEPDSWARIAHVLLPKDHVRLEMTGELATDKADGSGTGLFDLQSRDWSTEITDRLGIDKSWLPETLEGPEISGRVSHSAARALGLEAGTPVIAGGGDQAANAIGVGAVSPGVVALSLGTSGVVFATTDGPLVQTQGRVHSFCHAVPQRWHMMGVMLSAAGSLRWFRDSFAKGTEFSALSDEAATVTAGSDGILFLPHLNGERTPHPDPHATGAFVGLTVRHGRPHLARAVMEGVAFGLRDGLDLMVESGLDHPSQIRASGGGLKSKVWSQILADVLEAEIVTPSTTEGAAFGAALLAMVGAGWFKTVEAACMATVTFQTAATPGIAVGKYVERHEAYKLLYPALKISPPG